MTSASLASAPASPKAASPHTCDGLAQVWKLTQVKEENSSRQLASGIWTEKCFEPRVSKPLAVEAAPDSPILAPSPVSLHHTHQPCSSEWFQMPSARGPSGCLQAVNGSLPTDVTQNHINTEDRNGAALSG